MKKFTALLLGTVVSIAFTADAFAADPVSLIKNYWNSDDGNTGFYIGASYDEGAIDDVNADYLRSQETPSSWQLRDGEGATVQIGRDFGKIRFDWRAGISESRVKTIDNAALEAGTSDYALMTWSTVNVAIDIYRFVLIGEDKAFGGVVPVIALTPYIGAGYGYGGGWLTGKKNADVAGANTKRDAAGHGTTTSFEVGALVNVASFAGVTFGYQTLNMQFDNDDVQADLFNVGVRFTF